MELASFVLGMLLGLPLGFVLALRLIGRRVNRALASVRRVLATLPPLPSEGSDESEP